MSRCICGSISVGKTPRSKTTGSKSMSLKIVLDIAKRATLFSKQKDK